MTVPDQPPKLWPVKGEVENVPPWERPNLRSCLGSTDDKKSAKISARITPARARAISRMLAQRVLPELETDTDVVEAGISMVLAYAKEHGKDDKEFRAAVDIAEWESQLSYMERYYEKVSAFLDRTEAQLKEAKEKSKDIRFKKVFELLDRNRKLIEDEELVARANKLWVLYGEHAKTIRST